MYAKCGNVEDACRVFNEMQCGLLDFFDSRTCELWTRAEGNGTISTNATRKNGARHSHFCGGVLNACASVVALEEGRHVHEQIIQTGCNSDVFVSNSLIDMYAKCGSLEDAWRVFIEMASPDVVSWNVMLGEFAMHGHGNEALADFEWMCQEGMEI
jgi:pentatricopeptide repeat protein